MIYLSDSVVVAGYSLARDCPEQMEQAIAAAFCHHSLHETFAFVVVLVASVAAAVEPVAVLPENS